MLQIVLPHLCLHIVDIATPKNRNVSKQFSLLRAEQPGASFGPGVLRTVFEIANRSCVSLAHRGVTGDPRSHVHVGHQLVVAQLSAGAIAPAAAPRAWLARANMRYRSVSEFDVVTRHHRPFSNSAFFSGAKPFHTASSPAGERLTS